MTRASRVPLLLLFAQLLSLFALPVAHATPSTVRPAPASVPTQAATPLTFVANAGQRSATTVYETAALGGTVHFTRRGIVFDLPPLAEDNDATQRNATQRNATQRNNRKRIRGDGLRVQLTFQGASSAPKISAVDPQPGTVSYLMSGNPTRSRQGLTTYAGIVYHNLYPGIDLRYDGPDGQLKSTFTVAPGARPGRIRWQYAGAQQVARDPATNELVITLPRSAGTLPDGQPRTLREQPPVAWQEINGQRVPVTVQYQVSARGLVSFDLGTYDRQQPLIIDPIIVGTLAADATDLAVDSTGQMAVVTQTWDGPTRADITLTVYAPDSLTMRAQYVLAGHHDDYGVAVAFDAAGKLYLAGDSSSHDLVPAATVIGNLPWIVCKPPANDHNEDDYPCPDLFVARFAIDGPTLRLESSVRFGSPRDDQAADLVVDPSGETLAIAGTINMPERFTVERPMAALTNLRWIGSSVDHIGTHTTTANGDEAYGRAVVRHAGTTYLAGETFRAFEPWRVFVGRVTAAGPYTTLTTFGGTEASSLAGMVVDDLGDLYLTGTTYGTGFPVLHAAQATFGGSGDAFVTKLSATGTILYSTYLGGSEYDSGDDIAVDAQRRVWVARSVPTPYRARITRLEADGSWGADTDIAGTTSAERVTWDAVGNLYVLARSAPSPNHVIAKIGNAEPEVAVTVTDSTGRTVQALRNNADGWPILNDDTVGALANPLNVTVRFNNTATIGRVYRANLQVHSPTEDLTPTRFYVSKEPTTCSTGSKSVTYHTSATSNPYSYINYIQPCELIIVNSGSSQELSWQVWVQPSTTGTLLVSADVMRDSTSLPLLQQGVTIPQASTRPVVILPGILGSYPNQLNVPIRDEGVVLDPILGVYDGLVTNLQVLGYEPNMTIVPFPYKWYGEIRDSSRPNRVADHAARLKQTINLWWMGKTSEPYMNTTQFDLIAHSTGGLITRQYVGNGDNNKLHTVMLVGVPNQGSPKIYTAWEGAEPLDATAESDFALKLMFQRLANKAGCFDPYLPDEAILYDYIQGKPCQLGAQPGIPLTSELLPTDDAYRLYPYLKDSSGYLSTYPRNPTLNALNNRATVDRFVTEIATGGKLYQVYSVNMPTWKQFEVISDTATTPRWMGGRAKPINMRDNANLSDVDPDLGAGDSIVPAWSSNLHKIASSMLHPDIRSVELENVPHISYFEQQKSLTEILSRLIDSGLDGIQDSDLSKGLPFIAPTRRDMIAQGGTLWFANECPVTMLITDAVGRRVGTLPNGQDINEIPGAGYTGDLPGDDPEFITIPAPASGTYTVTITGQQAEPYRITAQLITSNTIKRLGLFTGIAQPGQVVQHLTQLVAPHTPRQILLVNDQSSNDSISRYTTALTELGRSADSWSVATQGMPPLSMLYPYDTVIWATGSASSLNTAQLQSMNTYMMEGGHLLLSGQDTDVSITDTVVFSRTFDAQVVQASVTSRVVQGEDLLTGLTLTLNGGDSANNQVSPTTLTPTGAMVLGRYTDGSGAGQVVGVRTTTFIGRLVYLGFGLEGLQNAVDRSTVLDRVLRWFETNATPSTPREPFPSGTVLDRFDRANGPVGPNWVGSTTSYRVENNALHNSSGDAMILWNERFGPDQEVYATVSAVTPTATEIGLVLKAQDTSGCNLLEVWYRPTTGTVQVWTCHDYGMRIWTQHGPDLPMTLQPGDRFGARANADGTVEIYQNQALLGAVTVSTNWPYRVDGGRVGIWLIDAPTTVLDDFSGSTLAPPTPRPPFPSTSVRDSFTRADGGVGSSWLGNLSGYRIESQALHNTGGNAGVLLWNESFGTAQEVFATVQATDPTATELGLVLKAQGTSDCDLLEVWYRPDLGLAQVWTCAAGTWWQHGSNIPLILLPGDRFGARAGADGTVEVFKNGIAVGSLTVDDRWPHRAAGGRVGVLLIDSPTIVLDDLGGGTTP
jgi:hypothetical protein